MNTNGELYLILSNIAMLPAIIYAWFRRLYAETALLITVATVSFLYHACQGNFFCIVRETSFGEQKFVILQNTDEFFVNITIIWFVMYFLNVPRDVEFAVVFTIAPILLISILSNTANTLYILIGAISVAGIVAFSYSLILNRKFRFSYIPAFIALFLLIGGSLFFYFANDPGTSDNYSSFHATWHVLLMLAVAFVLHTRYGPHHVVLNESGIEFHNHDIYYDSYDSKNKILP